ncbi:MAG: GNAT family N-acetyltransferase [Proteobacteria bacterium]|nr:GNAT family N-acetyltransferase [Pseudomonadota bacterium]
MQYMITRMKESDWPFVRRIHEEGISTGHATFEAMAPSRQDWDRTHLPHPRLVARDPDSDAVAGWGALAPASRRPVYSGVAEVSIYVSLSRHGQGIGRALLTRMISESESLGIWTIQAGIFPENVASIGLHKKCGFREVGIRDKIGKMSYGELKGRWRDVVLLERRSRQIGLD